MLRIIHLSDLHLGYASPEGQDTIAACRNQVPDRIADFFEHEGDKPDLLLFAGDLFEDHRPSDALVRSVIAAIKRLLDRGIFVVTLPGNHDEIGYHDSVYHLYEREWPGFLVTNTTLEDPIPLVVGDQRIYLVSLAYDARRMTAGDRLPALPPRLSDAPHIGLFHGALTGATADKRPERCFLFETEALRASGYDYIALGHQHRPRLIRATDQRSPIAYAGMIAGRNADDVGCGQMLSVLLRRDQPLAWEWLPLPESNPYAAVTLECDGFYEEKELQAALLDLRSPSLSSPAELSVKLSGELHFTFSPRRLAAAVSTTSLKLHLDCDEITFNEEALLKLAASAQVSGSLARFCLRDLRQTSDLEAKKRLHLALLQTLDCLGRGSFCDA